MLISHLAQNSVCDLVRFDKPPSTSITAFHYNVSKNVRKRSKSRFRTNRVLSISFSMCDEVFNSQKTFRKENSCNGDQKL